MDQNEMEIPEVHSLVRRLYEKELFYEAMRVYNETPAINHSYEEDYFYALCKFRVREYAEAARIFDLLYRDESKEKDTGLYFNLAVNLVLSGELERGLRMFAHLTADYKKKASDGWSEVGILYYKLHFANTLIEAKQAEPATKFMNEMIPVFLSIKDQDTTFLYMRGIPMFGDFLELIKSYLRIIPREKAAQWLEKLAGKLNGEEWDRLNKIKLEFDGVALVSVRKMPSKPNPVLTRVWNAIFWIMATPFILLLLLGDLIRYLWDRTKGSTRT